MRSTRRSVPRPDYTWHARPADRDGFDRRFEEIFLRLPDGAATRAMRALDRGDAAESAARLLASYREAGARPVHLESLHASAKALAYQAQAGHFLSELDGRVYLLEAGNMPISECRALAARVEALLAEGASCAGELKAALAKTLRPIDAREIVETQFRGLIRRLEDYRSMLGINPTSQYYFVK